MLLALASGAAKRLKKRAKIREEEKKMEWLMDEEKPDQTHPISH